MLNCVFDLIDLTDDLDPDTDVELEGETDR
jgi:hypothetical protein